jgi:hypothetical protein
VKADQKVTLPSQTLPAMAWPAGFSSMFDL